MALIKSSFPSWPNLSDFFEEDWLNGRFANANWTPAVNVVDNDDNYQIEVAVPGMKKKDFSVTMDNGILTISAETQKEEEEKEKNYTRKEFSSRSFTKSFTLPDNVKEEDVIASYEDGVLHLVLRKSEKALPPKKTVTIK